jgi:hypothetical protein
MSASKLQYPAEHVQSSQVMWVTAQHLETNLETVDKNEKEGLLHSPCPHRSGYLIVGVVLDDELDGDSLREGIWGLDIRGLLRSPPLAS